MYIYIYIYRERERERVKEREWRKRDKRSNGLSFIVSQSYQIKFSISHSSLVTICLLPRGFLFAIFFLHFG